MMTLLRKTALVALVIGAAGSIALMLQAGRNSPRLLVVLFTMWVLSPFVVLAAADAVSKGWSVQTRATLYTVMLVVALGSLVAYGVDASRPAHAQAAFIFVIVPPASWLLIAIALAAAALISRVRR